MVHVGPHVLQRGTHLDLETEFIELGVLRIEVQLLGDPADVVERHIAERILPQQFPLVHRIGPVHVEQIVHQCGDLVDFVVVEGDHAGADHIGDVGQGMVLMTLELQFSGQAVLFLHAGLDGRDDQIAPLDAVLQLLEDDALHPREHRQHFAVFFQDHRTVQVQTVFFKLAGHGQRDWVISTFPLQITVSMQRLDAA